MRAVCLGGGPGGLYFAISLKRRDPKHEVVVIERNPERMHIAMDQGFLAVEADASNEEVLRRVGINRARGFIAAVSTDAENVYAVLSARLLKPDLFIVGRAESPSPSLAMIIIGLFWSPPVALEPIVCHQFQIPGNVMRCSRK